MASLKEQISFFFSIFEPSIPSQVEIDDLAEVLGTRQEFVAYCFLRGSLSSDRSLEEALTALSANAPEIRSKLDLRTINLDVSQAAAREYRQILGRGIEASHARSAQDNEMFNALRKIGMTGKGVIPRWSDSFSAG